MKLLNYGAAGMIVFPILFLISEGITILNGIMHIPFGWAPVLAVVIIISVGLYDWSRRWIERHDRPGIQR